MTKAAPEQRREVTRGPSRRRQTQAAAGVGQVRQAQARSDDPPDAGLPRPELLVVRAVHPDARRSGVAGGLAVEQIPGFNEGLLARSPVSANTPVRSAVAAVSANGSSDGTWLGHVAEHVALELQRESGAHISRGKTRSAGETGRYNVIYGYGEEPSGSRPASSPSGS